MMLLITVPIYIHNHEYKKRRVSFKKRLWIFIEEKDIKNKLFDLIRSIFKDK